METDFPRHKTHFADLEIKERTAFSVSCCHRLFRTQLAAAKHIAWRTINDKYMYYGDPMGTLSDIKRAAGLDCECDFKSEYGAGPSGCPLHDRTTGYFRRLHKRLTKIIIKAQTRASLGL